MASSRYRRIGDDKQEYSNMSTTPSARELNDWNLYRRDQPEAFAFWGSVYHFAMRHGATRNEAEAKADKWEEDRYNARP